MHQIYFLKEPWEKLRQVILTTLFWNEPFQNQKFKKAVNDHYAEAAIDIVFKIGLLANLLSDNITPKFHYFSMKTEKCYMEDKKSHKFPKNGLKNRPRTSSNYVMTPFWFKLFLITEKERNHLRRWLTVIFGWKKI